MIEADRPTVAERYATATEAHSFKIDIKRTGPADVLIAAFFSPLIPQNANASAHGLKWAGILSHAAAAIAGADPAGASPSRGSRMAPTYSGLAGFAFHDSTICRLAGVDCAAAALIAA